MDADLIERLAGEAGVARRFPGVVGLVTGRNEDADLTDDIHRFAALIAEECAKMCDGLRDQADFPEGWGPVTEACAAAIRAKFKPS